VHKWLLQKSVPGTRRGTRGTPARRPRSPGCCPPQALRGLAELLEGEAAAVKGLVGERQVGHRPRAALREAHRAAVGRHLGHTRQGRQGYTWHTVLPSGVTWVTHAREGRVMCGTPCYRQASPWVTHAREGRVYMAHCVRPRIEGTPCCRRGSPAGSHTTAEGRGFRAHIVRFRSDAFSLEGTPCCCQGVTCCRSQRIQGM